MNNIDKAIYLASKIGANFANFDTTYIQDILTSKEYKILLDNIKWTKNFNTQKAINLQDDFKALNYDIKNIEESIILSSRVNYLALVSFENYYLNPFMKTNFKVRTNSIGDLMLLYDGKLASINDVILDTNHTDNYKMKILSNKCNEYASEIISKNSFDLSLTNSNKGIKNFIRKTYFINILKCIFSLAAFIASLLVFILDNEVLKEYISYHNESNIYTYTISLFLIGTYLSVFFLLINLCYISNFFYPYFYFKHELKTKINKNVKKILKSSADLTYYLLIAVKEKKILKDDINSFNTDIISNDEFVNYANMYTFKEKHTYSALVYLYLLSNLIMLVGLVISLVIYFVSKG